jgi:hypothetical protein
MDGSITSLGTEIRMGLIHDWLKIGHEVTVYSSTPKTFKEKYCVKPKISQSLFDFDDEHKKEENTSMWWDKIKLEPKTTDIDADVLWIECGQYQAIIADVQRIFQVLDKFSGRVIHHQHSNFSFPFGSSFATTTERQHSELNLTRFAHKYDVWTNKRHKVLSPTTNLNAFIAMSKDRGNYQEYFDKKMVEFGTIPPAYSDIEPFFPMKQNPTYDSLFIGGINHGSSGSGGSKNSRYEIIKKYYGSGLYKTGIIGNWSEKIKAKDGTESIKEHIIPNTEMKGKMGTHGQAYEYWNDSLTCINVSSEKNDTIGIVPSRFTMAMRGGSIVLTDDKFIGIDKFIDKKYIVNSTEQCKVLIDEIKSLYVEEREKVRQAQLAKFPKWESLNWTEIFS